MDTSWRRIAHTEIPDAVGVAAPGAFACAHRVGEDEVSALVPHANNIVILGWIDRIAELHGAHAGAARETVARDGRMWFVARHEIDYLGESFVGDALVIATWIEKLGRTSLTRATVIARADDGRPLVRASSRWAFVDLATRKPAAIPDAVRQALIGA
jgi:acyl-CoA thioester hydrolase